MIDIRWWLDCYHFIVCNFDLWTIKILLNCIVWYRIFLQLIGKSRESWVIVTLTDVQILCILLRFQYILLFKIHCHCRYRHRSSWRQQRFQLRFSIFHILVNSFLLSNPTFTPIFSFRWLLINIFLSNINLRKMDTVVFLYRILEFGIKLVQLLKFSYRHFFLSIVKFIIVYWFVSF